MKRLVSQTWKLSAASGHRENKRKSSRERKKMDTINALEQLVSLPSSTVFTFSHRKLGSQP